MASGLQRLRKEAGYTSARDFAEEIGIPAPTYARYESSPEKIPLKQAWLLADRLHASIDYVVGRTEDDPAGTKGDVQCAYEALDPRLQHSFDDFLDYLIERNVQLRNERVTAELRRYDAACYRLEQLFFAQEDREGDFLAFEDPDKVRARFRQFIEKRADEMQEPDVRTSVDAIMDAYDRTHSVFDLGGFEIHTSTYDARGLGGPHYEYARIKMPAQKGAPKQEKE